MFCRFGPTAILTFVTYQSRALLRDNAAGRATRMAEMLAQHASAAFDACNLAVSRIEEHLLHSEGLLQFTGGIAHDLNRRERPCDRAPCGGPRSPRAGAPLSRLTRRQRGEEQSPMPETETMLDERDGLLPADLSPAIHLDHCVIHVSDWARATAFYRDVLGAEVIPFRKGVVFRFGGVQLNVHGPGQIGEPVARKPVAPGGSDLCFRWSGPIEEAIAHLANHNVPVELGPVERNGAAGPGTSVYFRDPDGSLMEFITYPTA